MPDPKHLRLNDADDPDRATKFQAAITRTAGNGNLIIRQLVDAYLRYVDAHGHGPTFPVDLCEPEKKRRK